MSVFIGYPLDHKGYKLLNLDTKQIFISRHVVFHETIFPYHAGTDSTTSCDPFFIQNWIHDDVESDLPYPGPVISSPVSHTETSPPVSLSKDSDHFLPDMSVPLETSNFSDHHSTSTSTDKADDWINLPPDVDTLVQSHQFDIIAPVTFDSRRSTREVKRPKWWND